MSNTEKNSLARFAAVAKNLASGYGVPGSCILTQLQWKTDMERSAIIERLIEVMEDVFDLDAIEYRDELSAADIEEWDSLSNIRFIVAVEKEFGVRLTNSEIGGLENVGQLVQLIAEKSSS